VIINQNYFQNKDRYFKPLKEIAMGLPISRIIAEIYCQLFEELTIRHLLESGQISYYRTHM